MLINVELGLILCKVCVCVCPKTCSGKINSRDSRVFLPGLCLLPGDSERLHRVVILFSYGLVCTPIPRGVRAMSFYEVHFFRNSDPLLPPTARPSHPRTGHAKPVPMNGSLRGAPGRGPGLGDPELTSGQQQGRGTPSSGFAVATQCRVGSGLSGQPSFGPLGQRGRKFGWLWCGALPHWPKRLPRV